MVKENPEDYIYITQINKITKREALKLVKELDEEDPQFKIFKYRKYSDVPFQYFELRLW